MGNVNSAESPRRVLLGSNRLVKPRLGSAPAAGLSTSNAHQPTCDDDLLASSLGLAGDHRFSSRRTHNAPPVSPSVPFPPLEVDLLPQTDPLQDFPDSMIAESAKKERNLRRIFRSKSSTASQPGRRGSPERRNTTTAAAAPPLPPIEGQGVAPPTRRNSILGPADAVHRDQAARESWNIADSHVSWNYDLTSYEAKRLLNLVHGSTTGVQDDISAALSENKYSAVSEVTWKSSHPAQVETALGAALSRANSDLSLYTPVRRRSVIQTPGLATRRSVSKGPPLSNQRYSHPASPNLSRQTSSDSLGSRVLSMPPLPSRTNMTPEIRGPVTPCEGDYQTIGAFKLGTLRIVNGSVSPGAASPEPDKKQLAKKPDVAPPTQRTLRSFALVPRAELEGSRPGIRRDVDLHIRTDAPIPAQNPPAVVVHAAQLMRSPATPAKSPVVASPSLLQVRGSEGVKATGGQYLADIQFSPFALARQSPSSPLETTSKANEVEDHLFEDDDANPEYSTLEVLDLRLDPNAKSEPTRTPSGLDTAKRGGGPDNGFTSSNPSAKPLTKTDSGYCSNVSLRSLRTSSRPLLPDSDVSWGSSEGKQSSLGSPLGDGPSGDSRLSDSMFPLSPHREPPTPPPKDVSRSSRAAVSGSRTMSQPLPADEKSRVGAQGTHESAARRDSSAAHMRTWNVVPRSPEPAILSPASTGSDGSASKLSNVSGGSQKGGRLHRLLSRGSSGRSPSISAAHATHVSKRTNSASSSRDPQRKQRTHSGHFHISTRRLDLKSQASRDTLKTIMSVGSLEARAVEAAQNVEAALDPTSLNRRHTSYMPSSLGQVSSADSDSVPAMPQGTPEKLTRTMSIPRKPVPDRKDTSSLTAETASASLEPARRNITSSICKSPAAISRSNSMVLDKDELHFFPPVTEISIISPLFLPAPAREDDSSPPPVSPASTELGSRKRVGATPPPVSMRTRNQGNLRVPPPLRPKPTVPLRVQSMNLPRQTSQEQDLGHAAMHHQEALQRLSCGPTDVPPGPLSAPMQPRRSKTLEVRTSRSFTRTPDWQVKTDHDTSRRSSLDLRPEDPFRALEVVAANQGHLIQRPSSVQPQSEFAAQHRGPPLRHRASYDDRTQRHMQYIPPPQHQQYQQQQQRPAKPSTDPRWHRQSYDSYGRQQQQQWQQPQMQQQWHGQHQWNQAQHWDQSQQWDGQQYGQHPPHVARGGHGRNNSLGSDWQGQSGAPYRVLHSYNSPAYRNAPIWG